MKRKVAGASFIMVLLLSATGLMLVNLATANPMWYVPIIVINSDGSVVPKTEYIKQDGNVYTLTADFSQKYAIKIQCSNIVFDGAGHAIDGSNIYYGPANDGLSLESVTNVTVKDVQVYDFGFNDILIENCHRCCLFRVAAERVDVSGSENTITESSFSQNLGVGGSENLILGNTISYMVLSGEANIVAKNNMTGEFLAGGSRNSVIANRISSLCLGGLNNTFCANEIDWFIIAAASNLFYDNNFINVNLPELRIYGGEHGPFFWDNGEEGNYWRSARTRYTGLDTNGDGIGDLPYALSARYFDDDLKQNVIVDCGSDNYPLMSPFDIDDVSIWLPEWAVLDSEPDQSISILSPQNTTYTITDVPLNFTAPKSTKWTRYSLDGQANVTITGNTNLTALANGSHNLTLYIDDSLGNTRPSETITFTIAKPEPQPEPFPTLLVASASGVSIIGAAVCVFYYRKKRNH